MMEMKYKALLAIDAFVNLLLGALLLSSPANVLESLGLPQTNTYFYATILGGVIFGIGLALCIELRGVSQGLRGLGLGGAIIINVCGAGVLMIWLLLGRLDLPLRGEVVLWVTAVVVLGIGIAEIMARAWKYQD